ncbi:MAG TPA: glycosyltransferase family 2 protein [Casimicrobiaceae bacterium]|nr:glycosyltransferase family 2 protein [Casimicrobiaceae bacterium]
MIETVLLVPAYNEARTIAEVIRSTLPYAARVVVIDDGSTDGTPDALAGLPVEIVRHARNLGKSASLIDGFAYALALGARNIATMDADGQHRAADIPRLVRAAERYPHSIILGSRLRNRHHAPRQRRIANRLADFGVSWATGRRIVDSQSGQRLYPATLFDVLDVHRLATDGFTLESEILIDAAAAGFDTVSVPIDTIYDPAARPSYFRPIGHTAAIAAMLARRIVPNAFCLPGLVTSLRDSAVVFDAQGGLAVAAESGALDVKTQGARP